MFTITVQQISKIISASFFVTCSLSAFCDSFCSHENKHLEAEIDLNIIQFSKVYEAPPLTPGFAIFEGPVWINDGLVLSHIGSATDANPNPADIVVYRHGKLKTIYKGYGSNGLTLNNKGHLVAARHFDGTISQVVTGKIIASTYNGQRFNSPNDLVFSSRGDLYFTDPSWQNPFPTQQKERAYLVKPDGKIYAFGETVTKPNGVMLAKDEKSLYLGGANGLYKYEVRKNGSVNENSEKQIAADTIPKGVDGMTRDCAGNIYVTADGKVHILKGDTDELLASYKLPGATNIAFGGKKGKTIFITTLGARPQIWEAKSAIPGIPY